MNDGKYLRLHHECDRCGSSDAATTYHNGWTKCFSCGSSYKEDGNYDMIDDFDSPARVDGLISGTYRPLGVRKIEEKTVRMFDYVSTKTQQLANYRRKGKVVSQHAREAGKRFYWVDKKPKLECFGQHLWEMGGKSLIITEGEIDAMSWSQTRELRWPVVGVPGTGAIEFIKDNLEFISSFDEIILSFDMDDPGRKLVDEVAPLLPGGKVRDVRLPLKDANEVLVKQGPSALYNCLWQAKTWLPKEIFSLSSAYALAIETDRVADKKTGVEPIDSITGLLSSGEMVMIGAGSNIGKSLLIKKLAVSMSREYKCLFLPLEEGMEQVSLDLHSQVDNPDNLLLYKESGRNLVETIPNIIEYMAVGQGVDVVFIDHITAVLNKSGSDLKTTDLFLQNLQSVANKTGVILIYNSHVKDPVKGDYSSGVVPTSSSFRGTGMLFRIPDVVIGLGRKIESKEEKHITKAKVLKHRREGLRVGRESYYTLDNGELVDAELDGFNDDADEGDDF